MTRISNIAHDKILPDIIPFLQIQTIDIEGKAVVKTTVSIGTERPYYLAAKGLKPSGVYVRRGSACVPLNEAGIRQMIFETSGKPYEESRSLIQDLSFETLTKELKNKTMEFGTEQMKTLKLIGPDGLFTNLALLLSDQCTHTIKAAIFQGSDNAVFRDRKEFHGSLLKQLEEVYIFLNIYNKTEATFDGLRRIDRRDYPEEAIREALLYSIIHRDYLFSGSTIINVYDDRIEFISLGGLVTGISMEAIFLGASQSRNPNLASVFQSAEGVFSVTLTNQNDNLSESKNSPNTQNKIIDSKNIKDHIYEMVKEKGSSSRKEIEETFDISSTKSYLILKELCEEGLFLQKLNGRKTTYIAL